LIAETYPKKGKPVIRRILLSIFYAKLELEYPHFVNGDEKFSCQRQGKT